MTFDIEEWYTYKHTKQNKTSYYLPILERYLDSVLDTLDENCFKATFFCLGIIAREYPHIIEKIDNRGHEVACHSDLHKLVTQFNKKDFFNDTKIAKESLEKITQKKVKYYRAPAFSITPNSKWALEVLKDLEFECDCSIFSAKRRYGGFKDLKAHNPCLLELESGESILELPINYIEVFNKRIIYSGGGYFRVMPYNIIKKMLSQKDRYNMTYFHLRDFDIHQKKEINMSYFMNYSGINGAYEKFEKMIKENEFVDVSSAIDQINIDEIIKIKI
ncbi:polysaccharide deacetylase family protein [Tenacibaculum sp. FZY0031]|uniref:polysaccharide deacetylase family protein n=1 Tax=Tenacibaculum sp. FZY0031 TaxID=3116648 RepID=UPI002E9E403B|nr:polysaccharide deacetylase family protein [Tenacibaculum sp. FZY0031]